MVRSQHSDVAFQRALSLSRRQLLQLGSVGMLGLSLPDVLAAQAARSSRTARSCIFIFAWGGPSQLETWDLKPDGPSDSRGEFRPIATSVPGIQISEHFPRLSRLADKYAIIRSLTHDDPAHLSSVHHLLTGAPAPNPKSDNDGPSRRDMPHIGSVLAHLRPERAVPPFVTMPWIVSHPAAPGGVAPGQNGGWLGPACDPFLVDDPNLPDFHVPGLETLPDLPAERLVGRQRLLDRVNAAAPASGQSRQESGASLRARAMSLLTSPEARRAFAIEAEKPQVRDRYGRHVHGQCLLLARRLIEAGVRLVCVTWHKDGKNFWDTHSNNFVRLKNDLMPPTDLGVSALLEDLSQRGLLEETLVVWVGEFGRTPRLSRYRTMAPGRQHWPFCYSGILAGGGIRGGQVHGRSDREGAYPADNPVAPADLAATIYRALGIPPDTTLTDRMGRPVRLTDGKPVLPLLG